MAVLRSSDLALSVTGAGSNSHVPPVQLSALGPLALTAPDPASLELLRRQPKRMAVFLYLALATPRGMHRRDRLLTLFWPELDAGHARNALSQALYVIRNALGDDVIVTVGNEEVGVARERVRTDVEAFEDALAAGTPEQALELYRGDLLDGFFVSQAPDFERWLDNERERLRQSAGTTALALATEREAFGDRAAAVRYAMRSCEISPFNEAGTRRAMQLLDRAGERAEAMRLYSALEEHMRVDLDLAPSAETRAVVDTWRSQPGAVDHAASLQPAHAPARSKMRRALFVGAAATLVILASVGARMLWPADAPVMHFALELSQTRPLAMGLPGTTVALSPDGKLLLYVGVVDQGTQLFLRPLEQLEPTTVPNTINARHPFFSPDGDWIGFEQDGYLRKVRRDGSSLTTIARPAANIHGAAWGPDDAIVYATDHAIWRLPAAGATPVQIVSGDSIQGILRWPHVLPSGRDVLFTVTAATGTRLLTAPVSTGVVRELGVEGASPHFVPPAHLVFARTNGQLLTARFDPKRVAFTGPIRPIASEVIVGIAGAAKAGVSRSGSIVYVREAAERNIVLVDRSGHRETLPITPRRFSSPRVSRDGNRIALQVATSGPSNGDIWAIGLDTRTSEQLTRDGASVSPVWLTNDERIAYASKPGQAAGFGIRITSTHGRDSASVLLPPREGQLPQDATPDGTMLLFQRLDPATGWDLWLQSLDARSAPQPFVVAAGDQYAATISPDGRWVAYTANDSGQDEIYVRPLLQPSAARRVSSSGGREPRWSRDGRELNFRTRDGMVAASLSAGSSLVVTGQRVLFDDRPYGSSPVTVSYDVDLRGRFVFVERGRSGGELVVLLNRFTPKNAGN